MGTRQDSILIALELIKMLEKGPVTNNMLRDKFGMSRHRAYRWIRDASIAFPLYESGTRVTGKRGRESIEYSLLK
jgi:hypothetical protein